ncbi:MAG: segregation/condensation protein A [Candidatus Nanoarchaeia archaeon]
MTEAEQKAEMQQDGHERLYSILMEGDEVTWQSLLMELVRQEDMDPWNIDVSRLAARYISTLRKLTEMNLRVSGKVLLAAALLLRIKCTRLVGDDLTAFDQMLASTEDKDVLYEDDGEFLTDEQMKEHIESGKGYSLVPRTPQPRKRKVSVVDLIEALEQALQVKKRRVLREVDAHEHAVPDKHVDISSLLEMLMDEIELHFKNNNSLKFTDLCPEGSSKLDKIQTFVPLLYLATGRKVDLEQKIHFGEIGIKLANVPPELPKE